MKRWPQQPMAGSDPSRLRGAAPMTAHLKASRLAATSTCRSVAPAPSTLIGIPAEWVAGGLSSFLATAVDVTRIRD